MKYDLVIVGGGSAGCVLAHRLAQDPDRSVLLLEAGPDYPDFEHLPDDLKDGNNLFKASYHGPHTWGYTATATPQQEPFQLPRGKAMGGSSAVNGQVMFRGIPQDFDGWAAMGNDEWGFTKVLPYFRKLETDEDFHDDFHGTEGPIPIRRCKPDELLPIAAAFVEASLGLGFRDDPDCNHPESTGVGTRALNNQRGIRVNAAIAYLDQSRHRLNLTVRGNVTVRRVLFDGTRACGVEAESGGEVFTVDADEVVLSGGAIGSPQMLMLSGVGPAEHLLSVGISVVHDLPGVGENLRDHPNTMVAYRPKQPYPEEAPVPSIQVGLRYTTEGSSTPNDMQLSPIHISSGSVPATVRYRGDGPVMGFGVSLQNAITAGVLRLASGDPHVQPILDYRYLTDAGDRARMRQALRQCIEITEQPALQTLLEERLNPTDADLESDATLDAWLLANVQTQHHSSGTCKMGPASDPMAVVDQYCRVHGLQGIRVVDASVMPDVVRANTHASTLMIAEKVADWMSA